MPTAEPRITLDPAVLDGKPVVRGTRLSVEHVIGLLADGWSAQDILADCPGLTADDITACLAYARDLLKAERVYPTAAGPPIRSVCGSWRTRTSPAASSKPCVGPGLMLPGLGWIVPAPTIALSLHGPWQSGGS
jgi:uncharacterized protein (DUF433 family)